MACELFQCCQFFAENMREFPKTAEYFKERVCFGEYQNCNRYRIYKQIGGDLISCLDPDAEAVRKMQRCLKAKRRLQ